MDISNAIESSQMFFSTQQLAAVDAFGKGRNLFLTGSAGCGKTATLKEICARAKKTGIKMGITSTTGSSAILIGGRTIHSFLGIGLGQKSAEELALWAKQKSKHIVKMLRALHALVIEEVSMMDAVLFQKVSRYLSIIRECDAPFGGLQIVLIGDFCQLPPVSKSASFCFNSMAWEELAMDVVLLTTQFRQKDDTEMQAVLDEVRWGTCSDETLAKIQSFQVTESNGVQPTQLFSNNVDVDNINETAFAKHVDATKEAVKVYKATYGSNELGSRSFMTSSKVPEEVKLCVGAQVVVTWNVNQAAGIVNGTRGTVSSMLDTGTGIVVKLKNGIEYPIEMITIKGSASMVSITYLPIRLAYAITIHRAQGMTLDSVIVDLSKVFESGQAYTAISRVRDRNSITVTGVDKSSFKLHPQVLAFYKNLKEA
jgi:ATP-dependent DNA helicase PIF1